MKRALMLSVAAVAFSTSFASAEVCKSKVRSAPEHIVRLVHEIAPKHDVDPGLVLAMISVESAFDHKAVSHKNARGLMQIIGATFERFGAGDVFNPQDNIGGGVKFLRWLLDRFKGNLALALAGYNSGPGAVAKHGGIPPYKETKEYVRKVLSRYGCPIAVVAMPKPQATQKPAKVTEISYVNPWEPAGLRKQTSVGW
jgi:soluble lytic murein transglycosylase-like protein